LLSTDIASAKDAELNPVRCSACQLASCGDGEFFEHVAEELVIRQHEGIDLDLLAKFDDDKLSVALALAAPVGAWRQHVSVLLFAQNGAGEFSFWIGSVHHRGTVQ
jgi:hypothetical protein